jgi:hypothetical protein
MWGSCSSPHDCASGECLRYDAWPDGFCSDRCNIAETCLLRGPLPASGAEMTCGPISSLSYKFCILTCEEDAQCPLGMECSDLPNAPAEAPIQKICA